MEQIESNSNAQLAREIEFSLPTELTLEQNTALAHEYVKKTFVDAGMIADVCIHDTDTGNPHAHVMLIMRPLDHDGNWGPKSRKEYMLDRDGKRIKLPSGAYKSRKVNTVDWNDKHKLEQWRKVWADIQNDHLQKHGFKDRVDHRSYERQGTGQIPTIHLGVAAHQMEQKGIATDRGNHNRQVAITNSEMKQTKARLRKVKNWLYAQPIHNAPTVVDIFKGVANSRNTKTNWQALQNLKTSAKVLKFLSVHKINSVEVFTDAVERVYNQLQDTTTQIQKLERRLTTLNQHLVHADNHLKHKDVYRKYLALAPKEPSGFTLFRKEPDATKQDNFYDKHSDEIQAYLDSKAYLDNVMNGRKELPIKDWEQEKQTLLKERYGLCDIYYGLKDEVTASEHIRRSIEGLMREDVEQLIQRDRSYQPDRS